MSITAQRAIYAFLFVLVILYCIDIPDLYVDIDEAWLGEQAYNLERSGVVRSDMFADYLNYDKQILVYHKGFILAGAAFLEIFGFDLFSLRLVSLISTLLLFLMLYYYCRREYDLNTFLVSLIILLACPLIFRNTILYRPEPMLAMIGFAGFLSLNRYIDGDKFVFLLLSAILAGLAVFSHLNGLIFIGAGSILLIYKRKWKGLIWFILISSAVSLLYFYDVIGNYNLFHLQFTGDPSKAAENANWYMPFRNLLNEHKRIFRKPEIIGITSLFILASINSLIQHKRRNYRIIIYAAALVVSMGLINHNKTTKYSILYFPYFAVLAADHAVAILEDPGILRKYINVFSH